MAEQTARSKVLRIHPLQYYYYYAQITIIRGCDGQTASCTEPNCFLVIGIERGMEIRKHLTANQLKTFGKKLGKFLPH